MSERTAAARLAAAWLLGYPDDALVARLDEIAAVAAGLPPETGQPLLAFIGHLSGTPLAEVQEHYVAVFDMKRKACPYLTYWTDGDTRNRGRAILRFKQAY
ncbi:MAG: nitrate reductase molybdenum cofactor assembly chaperone, partial [Candidatus Nanopelagicales bacterium]